MTLEYTGSVRAAVLSLKYRGDTRQLGWMTDHLSRVISECLGVDAGRDISDVVVTWCPTTTRRRRRRGFDVGELLARGVARSLGCRSSRLLRRIDRAPQTGAPRGLRLDGPRLVARRPRPAPDAPHPWRTTAVQCGSPIVVVVDDVVTTGSSLDAARRALEAVGVPGESILCAAVAATPLGRDR